MTAAIGLELIAQHCIYTSLLDDAGILIGLDVC